MRNKITITLALLMSTFNVMATTWHQADGYKWAYDCNTPLTSAKASVIILHGTMLLPNETSTQELLNTSNNALVLWKPLLEKCVVVASVDSPKVKLGGIEYAVSDYTSRAYLGGDQQHVIDLIKLANRGLGLDVYIHAGSGGAIGAMSVLNELMRIGESGMVKGAVIIEGIGANNVSINSNVPAQLRGTYPVLKYTTLGTDYYQSPSSYDWLELGLASNKAKWDVDTYFIYSKNDSTIPEGYKSRTALQATKYSASPNMVKISAVGQGHDIGLGGIDKVRTWLFSRIFPAGW